jgi:hypothetical protein
MGIEAGSGLDVEELKDFFNVPDGMTLVAYDNDGNELDDDAVIGTGTVLVLYDAEGEVDRVTVVILGDVTGEGKASWEGATLVLEHSISEDVLEGPFLEATKIPGANTWWEITTAILAMMI